MRCCGCRGGRWLKFRTLDDGMVEGGEPTQWFIGGAGTMEDLEIKEAKGCGNS